METKRQLDVLDRRIAEAEYVTGSAYTIADMAIWPSCGGLAKGWLYGAYTKTLSVLPFGTAAS
jgi:GST-like protein